MQNNTYEFVPYDGMNYVFLTADVAYCLPHIHKEYEFGIVLDGNMHLNPRSGEQIIHPGEMWMVNPYQYHELASDSINERYLILEIQISRAFFHSYFSGIDRLVFDAIHITEEQLGSETYHRIRNLLTDTAQIYFRKEPNYELSCAGNINYLFRLLIEALPHHQEEEVSPMESMHHQRLKRITDYIDTHYTEKLLLSSIAEKENLTMNYLSHAFKKYLGMSFQSYLQNVRCQKAAILLSETSDSLTEISNTCGFSALKYMNQGFLDIFHVTPAKYRKLHMSRTGRTSSENTGYTHIPKNVSADFQDDKTKKPRWPFPQAHNIKESLVILEQYL